MTLRKFVVLVLLAALAVTVTLGPSVALAAAERSLIDAAKDGTAAEVQQLIARGADVNMSDGYGRTPLMFAITSGRPIEIVKMLLEAGANPNVQNRDGGTPLIFAITNYRSPEIIKVLLEAGANPNVQDSYGETPLMFAIKYHNHGSTEVVKMLLKAGADPNAESQDGWTALNYAQSYTYPRFEIIELLGGNKNNVSIDAQDSDGWTPLMHAVDRDDLSVVEALLSHGASVNVRANDGKTTAMTIAKKHNDSWFSDTEIIKALKEALKREEELFDVAKKGTEWDVRNVLATGASPNARDDDEETPLMIAAKKNSSTGVIETLVAAGADINAFDEDGRTPLMYAAKHNESVAIIQTLIRLGADVDARDYKGKKAVDLAEKNSPKIVKILMDAGSMRFLNIFEAARSGTARDIEMLVKAGANVNAQTSGEDSTSWGKVTTTALRSGAEVVEVVAGEVPGVSTGSAIVRGAAKVADNFVGSDKEYVGWTPLMFAAQHNSVDVVRALLKFGADVNLEAKDGTTALQLAGRRKAKDIINELRRAGAH